MMQVWVANIEERRLRRVRVVAANQAEARANLGSLAAGARLLSIVPASWTLAHSGADALVYLTGRDYLDWQGHGQTVQDWLLRALDPTLRGCVNDKLAYIGFRVLDAGLVAVANHKVAQLERWLQGTEWEGGLSEALAALPGARRGVSPRYFAGVQTRCTELPFHVVVPPVAQAAE